MIYSSLFYASLLLYTFPMWAYFEINEIHFFTNLEKNPPFIKDAFYVCVFILYWGILD